MPKVRSLKQSEWDFWHEFVRAQDDLCRELERELQREFGISKADFSLMTALDGAPDRRLRIGRLAEALGWDKGRVAHQVSRMEARGLIEAIRVGPSARRAGVTLTSRGRTVLRDSQRGHGANIRRLFFDALAPAQGEALHEWSTETIRRMHELSDEVA
ncbi:MAG TPA: MarR family winged helix-turn-helix transcriptional regulator [Solirubrobacterales bacterium]